MTKRKSAPSVRATLRKKTSPRPRARPPQPEATDDAAPEPGPPALVRLNKYLADRGVASRRKCDELIAAGKVSVDGEPMTELGVRIDPERQAVEIDGYVLKPAGMRKRYYLLNKPAGIVCTNEARETRPRAVDLITDPRKGRIYTVGRLDEESKGLIILTNDGEFANRIMHPRYGIEKTYTVRVLGQIDDETIDKIRAGVHLSEGRTAGARILVDRRTREYSLLTILLREGMNREIRRVFARFGYKVVDLRRTRIGNLSERGIKVGRWRELTAAEVADLLTGRSNADVPSEARSSRRPSERRPPGRHAPARRPDAWRTQRAPRAKTEWPPEGRPKPKGAWLTALRTKTKGARPPERSNKPKGARRPVRKKAGRRP